MADFARRQDAQWPAADRPVPGQICPCGIDRCLRVPEARYLRKMINSVPVAELHALSDNALLARLRQPRTPDPVQGRVHRDHPALASEPGSPGVSPRIVNITSAPSIAKSLVIGRCGCSRTRRPPRSLSVLAAGSSARIDAVSAKRNP